MDAPLPRTSRTSLGAGREGVMLLTIAQVADRLQCSRGHVHNLISARDYADTTPERMIPRRLRPLAEVRFPRPRYLSAGNRMPRIDERELQKWLEEQR